jgi:hypothetical protein
VNRPTTREGLLSRHSDTCSDTLPTQPLISHPLIPWCACWTTLTTYGVQRHSGVSAICVSVLKPDCSNSKARCPAEPPPHAYLPRVESCRPIVTQGSLTPNCKHESSSGISYSSYLLTPFSNARSTLLYALVPRRQRPPEHTQTPSSPCRT